jgi:hypothetical protein
MRDRILHQSLIKRISLLIFILIPLWLLSYANQTPAVNIPDERNKIQSDTTTPNTELDNLIETVKRASPIYKDIITGDLATSDVVWNTSLSFSAAPFPNTDELRLAFVASGIKPRFTELKVTLRHEITQGRLG